MEAPTISNIIKSPEKNITYNILAYKTLSRQEIVSAVQNFNSQNKRKRIEPGTIITILTTIGAAP
ncbi:hypothetical protein Cenrod_2218 [Candidatus Symbiobacter mobilis CR]|uniref:Uncharacterized protein n=1 Tax=Candidatus Symbiobacter mobilis CR TaxID=946483 RepID=U5NAE0_9BURK|nr:hypothetical protein Cenrod_2218 [Candidatus Symbiobacter mobilis CR]